MRTGDCVDTRPVPTPHTPGRPNGVSNSKGLGDSPPEDNPKKTDEDHLPNPLRAVLIRYACGPCGRFDPDGKSGDDGTFRCSRCLRATGSLQFAYTSLLYGAAHPYAMGALALGQSLRATGTQHDCVLLHTDDVPAETQRLLKVFWRLVEVPYIWSAKDVQTEPYEKARFKEVFTKLHAFNPAVLPYDRVVFLDLDMIVLRNVDALFELRTPAAMQNFKMKNQRPKQQLDHGDRIDVNCTHFNAGTMVLAPSRALFDLLVADVQEPDPTWHQTGYSPEQKYLSLILDGQWTHVSQLYNFEVQFHPGVPLTTVWQQTPASKICIAHYSGKKKVWDASPEYCAPVNGSSWSREIFEALPDTVRKSAAARCNLLHAEWQRVLARAWRECRASLNDDAVAVGETWGAALVAGELNSLRADFTGAPWPLPGDSAASNLDSGEQVLLEVLRVRPANGEVAVCVMPYLAQAAWSMDIFSSCRLVPLSALVQVPSSDAPRLGLGTDVVAWLGEGHARGLIVGTRRDERLVRFVAHKAPDWFFEEDLQAPSEIDGDVDPLQCAACLLRPPRGGCFSDTDGLWYCEQCTGSLARKDG